MKKLVILITILAVTGMAQAATLTWEVTSSLEDTQSGQGEAWLGIDYATEGINMYLIYNGVSGTAFSGVEYDTTSGNLELAGTDTALSWFDYAVSDNDDYTDGIFFTRTASTTIELTTFAPNASDWNNMDYSFTILAIKDTDGGDYSTGAWYGTYTGDAVNFSEGTTSSGIGNVGTTILDASGSGLVDVVPEPTVIALLGAGGLVMLVGRRIKFT